VVCWMSIGPCLQGPIDFSVVTGLFHWNHALSWPTVRIFLGQNGFTLRSPPFEIHMRHVRNAMHLDISYCSHIESVALCVFVRSYLGVVHL